MIYAPKFIAVGLCLFAAIQGANAKELKLDDLFPKDRLLEVNITIAEQDWDKIRYQRRTRENALPPSRQFEPPPPPYSYVEASVTIDGVTFPKVGLLSGFHKLKIYIYPVFIGFAFLTARQISLSFWFFFLMGGLLHGLLSVIGYTIPAASLGITFGPTLARPAETQMIGAYGIFFLFLLWLSRSHLCDILKQAVKPGPITGDKDAV